MRELTLIVTDLYLSRELREALADSVGERMPLPALELLLARASARRASEWRAFACEIAHVPATEPLPIAALTRLSDRTQSAGRAATEQWWLASPVHLTAALDHVQLSEVLALSPAEWREIVNGFNGAFGGDVGVLEAHTESQALWRPARALVAHTVDPARVAGGDMHDALPEGADGGRLKQLMTEVQMWLHEHPLNAARETAGVPTVNGVWFWGGGALPEWRSSGDLPLLVSNDGFMRGLWELLGGRMEPLRSALPGVGPGAVVAVGLRELPGASWLERLAALERAWLAPALSALRTNAVERLQLQINDALFVVRRADLRRFWRRPRPWLEAVA